MSFKRTLVVYGLNEHLFLIAIRRMSLGSGGGDPEPEHQMLAAG